MEGFISRNFDIQHGKPEEKREELLKYFENIWMLDEMLYTQLKTDDVFYHRGDPLRHVILFYYGHTAAFYINKFMVSKIISERINPEFESIFAIGVDEMSWDDLNNNHYNWPSVDSVRDYRAKVKSVVMNLIKTLPIQIPITWESPFWIILMSIEHCRIHIETSSVLIRQLPIEEVSSGKFGTICTKYGNPPENEFLPISGAIVHLGKNHDHIFYGWDNEYGSLDVNVSDFKATKYLISNGEFLEFVKDNGYFREDLWTEEGWKWKTYKQCEMPLFWIKTSDKEKEYKLRLVADIIDMPWNWPVEVNYLEAKAFANWKSKKTGKFIRLPTEAEWMRMFEFNGLKDMDEWPKDKVNANINLEHYTSSCPVDEFKQGEFYDIIGNVWQWTEDPIAGYPGFTVHPVYDDFTVPTIDGKHNLIKGGSWISTGDEAQKYARYAFRRHFYQHAGFRLVESDQMPESNANECEKEDDVTISCELNYGKKKCFATDLLNIILENPTIKSMNIKRVLDLNADTGRLAFELAKHFDDVTGLDFSARFIRIGVQLQEKGSVMYMIKGEGDISLFKEIHLKDFDVNAELGKKILFMQTDPHNIKKLYTGYDLIVVPNLLEEMYDPRLLLEKIHERLNSKGILLIASAYEWNSDISEKTKWIGGFKKDGENFTSLDGLKEILGPKFDLINEPQDLVFNIRKSSRVSEERKTQITIWQLK